jgi:hypothetical protein
MNVNGGIVNEKSEIIKSLYHKSTLCLKIISKPPSGI